MLSKSPTGRTELRKGPIILKDSTYVWISKCNVSYQPYFLLLFMSVVNTFGIFIHCYVAQNLLKGTPGRAELLCPLNRKGNWSIWLTVRPASISPNYRERSDLEAGLSLLPSRVNGGIDLAPPNGDPADRYQKSTQLTPFKKKKRFRFGGVYDTSF